MAGRGRGHRMMSFSVDAAGIRDSLPPTIHQPTPVFPVMEHKPLPLTGGEEAEYLLALKQDCRGAMRSLPCFIQPAVARRDVERYSDKYHVSEQTDRLKDWVVVVSDWKRFPRELRVHVRKAPGDGALLSCRDSGQQIQKKKKKKVREEILLKLETLEKKEEQESSEGEGETEKKQDEGAEAEEEYDEEEFEEETDYIMSYFENGEDFGGDSDDNMDEAIY
uniref:Polymerase (RNA) III (DNA directed) polypeptide G like b n=1 Tax=Nothobranchius korthausae TaxID=1143690 RepID=A0A1A8EZT8_9TELE